MEKRYYIAYGSNLNLRQMRMRCPGAKVVGKSVIDGYELLFKGSMTGSYLTIEKKKGGKVPVAVFEVTKRDELALDAYEGYPNYYYKAEMKLAVTAADGHKRTCCGFVYIMHEERTIGIPTGNYMRTCLEGYNDFAIPTRFLIDAWNRSKEAAIYV